MSKIIWHESFSVGVEMLDEHHKYLAKLINQLSDYNACTTSSEQVVDVISELVQYALYHFKHEEELMARHQFPKLDKHSGEHTQFCEVITETSYGATIGIIDITHLADYLVRWWKNHILHEDMQFKPFFASLGVN